MGRTPATNSTGLSFDIDRPRGIYRPGDIISGHIMLDTNADVHIGNVSVSFWARSKVKMLQSAGQSVPVHRGRTLFFHTTETLYEGQYTHKAGSSGWPFHFVVPAQADPTCLSGQKSKGNGYFRSTEGNQFDLTLPPTMYHFRNGPANNECFVEYVLEARVTEAEDLHRTRSPKVNKSTYPIVFHPSSTPKPIEEYNLLTKNQLFSITTMRLLPQYTGTMLRIRDRARSIFRPRSMPRFSFILTVQSPTIIQLFHPDPIPFLISVTLDPSSENRNIAEPYPEIVLRSLKVDLRSWVGYRADQYSELTWASTPIHACNMLNQVLAPTEDGGAPLNIGTLYNFRLGNAILGSQADSQLYPTFTSYDIVRKYLLTWEVEVQCAEKKVEFNSGGNQPGCTVIGPPASVLVDYQPKKSAMRQGHTTDCKTENEKPDVVASLEGASRTKTKEAAGSLMGTSRIKAEEAAAEDRQSDLEERPVPDTDSDAQDTNTGSRKKARHTSPNYVPRHRRLRTC